MAAYPQQHSIVMAQPHPSMVQTVNTGHQSIGHTGMRPQYTPANNPRDIHKKSLHGVGITECIIGPTAFVLAVIAIALIRDEFYNYYYSSDYDGDYLYYDSYKVTGSSQGAWCGLFISITGILGIKVKNVPTRRLYAANMAMAIITSIVCLLGMVMSAVAAALSGYSEAMIALHLIIGMLCFVAMILSIAHAALCCSGACTNTSTAGNQQVMYVQQQVNTAQPQPQYVQGPNGQLMMVTNQPVTPQYRSQDFTIQQSPGIYPVNTQSRIPNAPRLDESITDAFGKSSPCYSHGY